jgi:hypothetical protein
MLPLPAPGCSVFSMPAEAPEPVPLFPVLPPELQAKRPTMPSPKRPRPSGWQQTTELRFMRAREDQATREFGTACDFACGTA